MGWLSGNWVEIVIGLIGLLHILPNDKVEAFGENYVGRFIGWFSLKTATNPAVKLLRFLLNTTCHLFIGIGRGCSKAIEAPPETK